MADGHSPFPRCIPALIVRAEPWRDRGTVTRIATIHSGWLTDPLGVSYQSPDTRNPFHLRPAVRLIRLKAPWPAARIHAGIQASRADQRTPRMKRLAAAITVLPMLALLLSSPAFAQQFGSQVGTPAASRGAGIAVTRESPALGPSSSQGVARIRIIGSPSIQPTPGLNVECTPVEESIAGVIVGPNNLCDR
jgi:hypothetical protein